MIEDKRTKRDGDYLSKSAVNKLNDRHGWFQYADAQSDVSNAFANNSIHAFLESAKEAQEVQQKTGLSPKQISEQRDDLINALQRIHAAASATWSNQEWIAEHAREILEKAQGTA